MLKEALEHLARQACDANLPLIAQSEAEPKHVYFLNGERKEAIPKPRAHVAADLSAIVDFAQRDDFQAAKVWYSRDAVVCVLNDETRRDKITLTLKRSPQMAWVEQCDRSPVTLKQGPAIHLIRTMFKDCMAPCPRLLDSIRNVKFINNSAATASVNAGKRSVNRDVEQSVQGLDSQLIEDFELDIPVFDGVFRHITGRVRFFLDTDAASESFKIHVIQGDVEKVLRQAEDVLGTMLAEQLGSEGGKVLYGQP